MQADHFLGRWGRRVFQEGGFSQWILQKSPLGTENSHWIGQPDLWRPPWWEFSYWRSRGRTTFQQVGKRSRWKEALTSRPLVPEDCLQKKRERNCRGRNVFRMRDLSMFICWREKAYENDSIEDWSRVEQRTKSCRDWMVLEEEGTSFPCDQRDIGKGGRNRTY